MTGAIYLQTLKIIPLHFYLTSICNGVLSFEWLHLYFYVFSYCHLSCLIMYFWQSTAFTRFILPVLEIKHYFEPCSVQMLLRRAHTSPESQEETEGSNKSFPQQLVQRTSLWCFSRMLTVITWLVYSPHCDPPPLP